MRTFKLSSRAGMGTAATANTATPTINPKELLRQCEQLIRRADESLDINSVEYERTGGMRRRRYSRHMKEPSFESSIQFAAIKIKQLRLEIAGIREQLSYTGSDPKSKYNQTGSTMDMDTEANFRIQLEKRDQLALQYRHVVRENSNMENRLMMAEEKQRQLADKLENTVRNELNFLQRKTLEEDSFKLRHIVKQLARQINEAETFYCTEYQRRWVKLHKINELIEEQDEYLSMQSSMQLEQRRIIEELEYQLDNRRRIEEGQKNRLERYRTSKLGTESVPIIHFRRHSNSMTVHQPDADSVLLSHHSSNNRGKLPTMKLKLQLDQKQRTQPDEPTKKKQQESPPKKPANLTKLIKQKKASSSSSSSSSPSEDDQDGRLFKPVKIQKEVEVAPKPIPLQSDDIDSSDSDIFKPTKISQRKVRPNITVEEIRIFKEPIMASKPPEKKKPKQEQTQTPKPMQKKPLSKAVQLKSPFKVKPQQRKPVASVIAQQSEVSSNVDSNLSSISD